VADAISSKKPNASEELWSDLQMAWLEIPIREGSMPTLPTWEDFSVRLDRCFRQSSLYVGQHVNDRSRFRQVVTEVLTGSRDLFMTPSDEREELRHLKASADRLLALEAPALPGNGTSAQAVRATRSRFSFRSTNTHTQE
jgi:hypothetical protein